MSKTGFADTDNAAVERLGDAPVRLTDRPLTLAPAAKFYV
jgi:hypothetical protein